MPVTKVNERPVVSLCHHLAVFVALSQGWREMHLEEAVFGGRDRTEVDHVHAGNLEMSDLSDQYTQTKFYQLLATSSLDLREYVDFDAVVDSSSLKPDQAVISVEGTFKNDTTPTSDTIDSVHLDVSNPTLMVVLPQRVNNSSRFPAPRAAHHSIPQGIPADEGPNECLLNSKSRASADISPLKFNRVSQCSISFHHKQSVSRCLGPP